MRVRFPGMALGLLVLGLAHGVSPTMAQPDKQFVKEKLDQLLLQQAELKEKLGILEQEIRTLAEKVGEPTHSKTENGGPPITATGPRGGVDPLGLVPLDLTGNYGQVTSSTAFNPLISVIADGLFYDDSRGGTAGELVAEADGFHSHGGGEESGHHHGGDIQEGFSLRETEVAFSGSVDPYFDAWAIVALTGGEAEVEEAFIQTRRLLPGLQLKAGKFFSGIGYLNKQHPHQWDFVDQPLPYQLLLGGSINDTGIQLNWLPDLPVYTLVGLEALQGENGAVAHHLGRSSETPYFKSKAGPRLWNVFLKVAPDAGPDGALQGGLFFGTSSRHQELHDEDEDGITDEALQGHVQFFGTDWVYKYESGRPFGAGNFSLQAEYLRRIKDLRLMAEGGNPVASTSKVEWTQDALYVQGQVGIAPRWTLALRFDLAGMTNRVEGTGETGNWGEQRRYSAALAFNPTEFSRLRLQFNRGTFSVDRVRDTFNQIFVQFQVSLGAHGAHRF